jgi:hypothetical protein
MLRALLFSSAFHRAFRVVGALLILGACSGKEGSPTGNNQQPSTGSLTVTISGAPQGATGSILISGPNGFSRSISVTTTLSSLAPGLYDINAPELVAGEDIYGSSQVSQSVGVTAGGTANAGVSYALVSGSLSVSISGLPTDANAAVLIAGPSGFSRVVTSTSVIGGLRPGTYTITAGSVPAAGHTFASSGAPVNVQVSVGTAPAAATFTYAIASGAVTGTISGLPPGTLPMLVLNGPGGAKNLASGSTITNLAPGTYSLTGAPAQVGQDIWSVPVPTTVTIAASPTPVAATVVYALASGRMAISVSGLPSGASAAVSVSGPAGFQKSVTASETLTGLTPGTYTIAAASVSAGSQIYQGSPSSQQVVVPASTAPVSAEVTYAPNSGSLSIVVNGLSQSIPASVLVTGPQNYSVTVSTTTLLSNLKPGTYTVAAANAAAGLHVYAPTPASQQVAVTASVTPATASVQYALSSGMLQISVTGLPAGVSSPISVTGPSGYSASLTGGGLLTGLKPGTYTIAASTAQNGPLFWAPNPASQQILVSPSISAVQATVNYATANGGLTVTINGLPGGVSGAVLITGPSSYSQLVTGTTTLLGILQGIYTATASVVSDGGLTFTPAPATQNVSVGGGVTSSAVITYTQTGGPPPPPPGLNLTIDGLHVQQVVQAYAGTVPLLAGRSGLLRVFVKANTTNTAAPAVRVRFYDGVTLNSTVTITAPGAAVPTAVTEGTLTSSWNYTIPAGLMQPGLRILADVDPTNTVVEISDGDNTFPVSGTAATMDVRTVPALDVRFVPVTQSANGMTGVVNAGNVPQFLADTKQLFPLDVVNSDVRAAYTTAAPALVADESNGAWSQILSEISALRAADGSTRYYIGVVKVGYGSGVAGIGYVPGRSTLTWDHIGSASGVLAHELGHNFGRSHAPCGGPAGPDPSYPYAGGGIGVFGFDGTALKNPSTFKDLMGYCGSNWISDYTYKAVLTYRAANPFVASAVLSAPSQPRRGLLIWGRVDRGNVILEPAYEVDAPPSLPSGRGANRLELLGPLGERLLDLRFDGERPADITDATAQHFSFVVPFDAISGTEPAHVRVTALGRTVERSSRGNRSAAPTAQRIDSRHVRIRWSDPGLLGVLVRDAGTGEILSFARGGETVVRTAGSDVDLTLSDGVRSARQRVRVRQ